MNYLYITLALIVNVSFAQASDVQSRVAIIQIPIEQGKQLPLDEGKENASNEKEDDSDDNDFVRLLNSNQRNRGHQKNIQYVIKNQIIIYSTYIKITTPPPRN